MLINQVNPKTKRLAYDGPQGFRGDKITIYHPIYMSHIKLIDPSTDKPGKVSIGYLENGESVRIFKKTGSILNKPPLPFKRYAEKYADRVIGPFDTSPEETMNVTHLIS